MDIAGNKFIEERRALVRKGRMILDTAGDANRELTAEETKDYDKIMAEVDTLDMKRQREIGALKMDPSDTARATGDGTFRMADGAEGRIIKPGEVLTEKTSNVSVGRMLRAAISGQYKKDCNEEERALLQMGSDTAGGYTVPADQSAAWLQNARNNTITGKLCTWVQMPHDNLRLVGTDTDPTASFVGEGAALTEGTATFRAINLAAKKVGTYLVVTKEMMHSANIISELEEALRYSVSNALDSAILEGASGVGITGIANTSGIGNTDYTGSAYGADEVLDNYYTILGNNSPQTIDMVYNTDIARTLQQKKDGEGNYILTKQGGVPEAWSNIRQHVTNVLSTTSNEADIFYGPFKEIYLGYHGDMEFLVSESAYSSDHNGLTEAKVFVRVLFWADTALNHANWFYHAQDVSTA